jgi:two-component system phosphate regulon sensor histidine kinase PhoR
MTLRGRPWIVVIGGGLLVVGICGVSLGLIASEQERQHNQELTRQLLTNARMLNAVLREQATGKPDGGVSELVRTLQAEGVQVILMDARGSIWLDTSGQGESAALLAAVEVRQAMQPGRDWGTDTRAWGPDQQPHVMVALRVVGRNSAPLGVIWLSCPEWSMTANPWMLGELLAIAGGAAALGTLILVIVYIRLRRRVLLRAIKTVRGLSSGDLTLDTAAAAERPRSLRDRRAELGPLCQGLTVDLEVTGQDEVAVLSSLLNALRRRLASQVALIERQRRMLQSLVDELQEGVIVAGPDGRIALINPTAVRLLGLRPGPGGISRLVGQPLETCIPHHPLQRLLTWAASEPGEPAAQETRLEIETESGTVHLLARASEVALAEGSPGGSPAGAEARGSAVGRVVMLTDITKLHRIVQMRSDFVANASHELRTPLSTIRAAVETLLTMDLPTEAPAARTFLEKIDRHTARLEAMVADLLDLSRLEMPAERFEPEPVDLRRFLDDLHARFAEALERKPLHCQLERPPAETATIRVNPHLLRMALDNLVDNAIKFTDPGGHIGLSLRVAEQEAVFEVSDDGCGIPEEEQQRVFERFYQVQRARSGGPERGTGLGLSIVRHAVEAMHGTVRLESRLGEGTRVSVTIPQARS